MSTHRLLRDILDADLDFESPIDEDLMLRLGRNLFLIAAMLDGDDDRRFKAQSNGIPTDGGATSVLTIDTITVGVFERDDQYNGAWLRVTSGAASGNGYLSQFPITDSDEGAQTFTVGTNKNGQNLNQAGMGNNDTFEIIGHVHDGIYGEKIHASDIEETDQFGLKDYTQAGRTQSVSRTDSSGTSTGTHNLVLPESGVDYYVFGHFHTIADDDGINNTHTGYATVQVPNQDIHESRLEMSDIGANNYYWNHQNSGGLFFIAQNGNAVTAQAVLDTNNGTVTAKFTIEAYQKVPV